MIKSLKALLRDSVLYDWVIAQRQRKALDRWNKNGRHLPAPSAIKQRIVGNYGERYGLRILVETGTFVGDMVVAQRRRFERIYTIELDPKLHEHALLRFKKCRHVTALQGDSGVVLPQLVSSLPDGVLFWLDGHWSDGITAHGDKATPIVAELDAILSRDRSNDVILIDDARCFTGDCDYPSVVEIEEMIHRQRPELVFSVDVDIIRVVPPTISVQYE
jgi:hypothetical protein